MTGIDSMEYAESATLGCEAGEGQEPGCNSTHRKTKMKSQKVFLSVLYLLLYSSFSTADLNPDLVNQVEKGTGTTVQLLTVLGDLSEWASKSDEGAKVIQKVFEVFDKLGKIASSLSFIGALVSFIFAFIPKQDPVLEFMKVQFAEVNRKLDSISLQINSLGKEIEWATYASVYSGDENNIKTSWIKLREFIDTASAAKTDEEKTRLAERFTNFYENSGTEKSVYNFHSYLTENNPVSLNKNLLVLVTQKSKGDFNTLVQFTSYFTSLVVTGLQLNLHYYALKGYDVKLKAKEAVTQLTNIRENIQAVLIECLDSFEAWAEKDVREIGTKPLPENKKLAYNIKEHLDKKFNWHEWTVIVHDKTDREERTYGNSINVIAQGKVRCSCVSPWLVWNGHDARSQGCRYQNLRWVSRNRWDAIPQNAVRSPRGHHVCRTKGLDGGWHGGWIWIHHGKTCNYDYDWKEIRTDNFEVLVDPCGGKGVQWLGGGIYHNTVEIGQAINWPWITYLVCSPKSNGVPGKLFNTRHGLMCHYGYHDRGHRDSNFYSLVKKTCI
ncbi:hypothetical protein GJAV_G00233580 [Gymnothorax javanicus]|nr:hypothetical protein GJAV_G00233580 [Gymnothorax javanicus]